MKTKYFLLTLICSLIISNMSSQEIDLFGTIRDNVDEHNEQRGIEDTDENSGYSEEDMERFREYWDNKTKDAADFLNGLDDPNHHCLALACLYAFHYDELQKEVDAAENCKMKYDLKGMQALAIFTGTTIMPCTEGLNNLSRQEKVDLHNSFIGKLVKDCGPSGELVWTDFAKKAPKTSTKIILGYWGQNYCEGLHNNFDTPRDQPIGELLNAYFHPKTIAEKLLTLSMQMEALGCGG